MKKTITLILCLFMMGAMFAQNDSAHMKFMGVDVNGQVSTVEQRLALKGFLKTKDEMYKGKFSGYDVKLELPKTVKTKTVYAVVVHFGKEVSQEELVELSNSLSEKYGADKAFKDEEEGQAGIVLPEGRIVLNYEAKTLSYIDKANFKKVRIESQDDL